MFFVNATITATDKLSFYVEGVYTSAKGSFDPFDLPTPDVPADAPISPDGTYADYDFSVISGFSDLDYAQKESTIGVNYRLDPRTTLYGSVNLLDLQDDQMYVYGDLSGTIYTYAAGMNMSF